jgi:hypothetical protein
MSDNSPIYILNSAGIAVPVGPANPLPTSGGSAATSVAINDGTVTTQKATVDGSGNLHVAVGAMNLTQVGGSAIALGQALMAASLPVTMASNQSNLPENLTQVGGAAIALGQALMAASMPVTIASNQSAVPSNMTQIGGAALALGQAAMAASLPVAIASNQSNLPENLTQVGGAAIALGQAAMAASMPVAIASNQSTLPENLTQIAGNAVVTGTATGATLANILEIITGLYNGTTVDAWRGTQGVADVSSGGRTSTAIAASTSANTVIKASAGRCASILVTTTGTNALQVFDNASAASGTIIAALPTSPAIGLYVFGTPAANGITVGGNANNPGVTVFWY